MSQPFEGKIGRTYDDSEPWWPPLPAAPDGAPNVVVVLLDDVGYAQFGCYGSDIDTPCFDRLAAHGRRYANFHTTALCSPTAGVPAHRPQPPLERHGAGGRAGRRLPRLQLARSRRRTASSPRSCVRNGYATYAVGKWHLTPGHRDDDGKPPRQVAARPRASSATTASWAARPTSTGPTWSTTTTPSNRHAPRRRATTSPRTWPTRRIHFLKDLRATAPTKPFFLWFTPGAVPRPAPGAGRLHRPLPGPLRPGLGPVARGGVRPAARVRSAARRAPSSPSARRGCRRGTRCRRRAAPLRARMMEVFAGFLTHTDAQVARVLDFVDRARRARQHDRAWS